MAILQGFAKHTGEEEKEREGCTSRERSNHVLWAALGLTIYRGEGGGCAPSRVPTLGGAAALDGKGAAAKGRIPSPPRHLGGAFPS